MHRLFKALGDPHRFAIVRSLLRGERHVQALADELGITQPAVSRHVRLLQSSGLVSSVREGRKTLVRCPPADASPEVASVLAIVAGGDAVDATAGPRDRPPTATVPRRRQPRVVSDELEDYLL